MAHKTIKATIYLNLVMKGRAVIGKTFLKSTSAKLFSYM